MSWFVRCDYCNARTTARFDGGPHLPPGWAEWSLDNFAFHGCSREHLELAKAQDRELTPFSDSSTGVPLP